MRYKAIALLLVSFVFATVHLADAQQLVKSPRIGFFVLYRSNDPASLAMSGAFRHGLREQGWIEAQNIAVDTVSQRTVSTSWPTWLLSW